MINTGSLQTCTTAARFKATYQKFLDDAADIYGRDTREYNAFKTLLDNDAARFVEAHVRHLNEVTTRYTRETSEWLALLPPVPMGISHG